MSRDEILALKPGRELDAEIALRIFKVKEITKVGNHYFIDSEDTPMPHYSTNIAAAFEILDKFDGYEVKREPYTRRTEVRIYQFSNMKIHRAVGESVPDVACKAALLAVLEGEKDD